MLLCEKYFFYEKIRGKREVRMGRKKVESDSNIAVHYIRVSTDDQARDPENLDRQKAICGGLSAKQNHKVIRVFVDPGESARTSNRPEFQAMLAFCRDRKNKVRYVVVQDLSRFARNLFDQAAAIAELRKIGIVLLSVYESNIDDTAAGQLAANIFGAFNQYFSDAHSEKQKARSRQAAASGRYPRSAIIGYINVRDEQGARIDQDSVRAPFILRGFCLIKTRLYKVVEVLRILNKEGFTTRKGHLVSGPTFHNMLRNPFYAGWIRVVADPSFEPVRGLHRPIVDQATFDEVQNILDGKKPARGKKLSFNPLFPLRHSTLCAGCGTPITGAPCRSHTGQTYPRYWCRNPKCYSVRQNKLSLESDFVAFLRTIHVDEDIAAEFQTVAAQIWKERQGNFEQQAEVLAVELEQEKKLKGGMVRLLALGKVTQVDYDQANADSAIKIADLTEQLRVAEANRGQAKSFSVFAKLLLVDFGKAWMIAGPEERARVQNLLFEDGLIYSQKNAFLNPSNSSIFNTLGHISSQKSCVVEAAGVEPASEKTVNRERSCFFRSHLSRSECLQRTKTHSPPA